MKVFLILGNPDHFNDLESLILQYSHTHVSLIDSLKILEEEVAQAEKAIVITEPRIKLILQSPLGELMGKAGGQVMLASNLVKRLKRTNPNIWFLIYTSKEDYEEGKYDVSHGFDGLILTDEEIIPDRFTSIYTILRQSEDWEDTTFEQLKNKIPGIIYFR